MDRQRNRADGICDRLWGLTHNGGETGFHYDDIKEEFTVTNRAVIDCCLKCPYKECLLVRRKDTTLPL